FLCLKWIGISWDLTPEDEFIITAHQVVRNAHQLTELIRGRLVYSNVIAQALAHLFYAIEPFEKRHFHDSLLRLVLFFLEIAPDQNVKKLVGPAELHVRPHHHRIPPLHDRILNFMRVDRALIVDPRPEILALEHLL